MILDADKIFGNEAAEDEEPEKFKKYAIRRDDFADFWSSDKKFLIANANKGSGKSALCIFSNEQARDGSRLSILEHSDTFHLERIDDEEDFSSWSHAWQQSLINVIGAHLGNTISKEKKVNINTDDNTLIEASDHEALKELGYIRHVTERVSINQVGIAPLKNNIKLGNLKRAMKGKKTVWVFIDDIDSNFDLHGRTKIRIASFYDACRKILNDLPELRIRTTIRPNVWKIIARDYSALQAVRQYLMDLRWTANDLQAMLASRINAYKKDPGRRTPTQSDEDVVKGLFTGEYDLGTGSRTPAKVLSKLAKMRPRWLIELCKSACVKAKSRNASSITFSDVSENMRNFGENRVSDYCAEYRSLCTGLPSLIELFRNGSQRYRQSEIYDLFKRKKDIIEKISIAGIRGKPSGREILKMLYIIGFLDIREEKKDGTYEIISVDDSLSASDSPSMDQNGFLEIHPCFRDILNTRQRDYVTSRSASRRKRRTT